ncbi:putative uncharacterized protein [Burkholderiales bacterium GJ-E10]|nr:putative uncharacterized protein [Burkholderiales bacterium GJ-E10]
MIDIDNPPLVLFCIVMIVLIAPQFYALVIDKWDKNTPQIKN